VKQSTNQALSNPYTILNDRILWWDGDSSWSVKALGDRILSGEPWAEHFVIDADDFSVKQLNDLDDDTTLEAKTSITIGDDTLEWNVPVEYFKLDVKRVIYTRLKSEFDDNNFSTHDEDVRIERVKSELETWEERELIDVLRLLMYVVDTFVETDTIWGTGRGSSCCSYVLYLIGVHDVDSIFYDLDITDFFRA
jgi:hypothetical protein